MIIDKIVNRLENISPEIQSNRHMEIVYLPSHDLLKRIQRVVSDHGTELGISLSSSANLNHGDVLYMDDTSLIVVEVLPEDVLVIKPSSIRQMGDIAHKIGNRHLPAQFEGDRMLVQYDYLVEDMLKHAEVPYSHEKIIVKQPFRPIGHSHG